MNWNITLGIFWHPLSLLRVPFECLVVAPPADESLSCILLLKSGCWRLGLHRPFLRVPSLFSQVATVMVAYCLPLSPLGLLRQPSFVFLSILTGFVVPAGTRGSIFSRNPVWPSLLVSILSLDLIVPPCYECREMRLLVLRSRSVLESMQTGRVSWKKWE